MGQTPSKKKQGGTIGKPSDSRKHRHKRHVFAHTRGIAGHYQRLGYGFGKNLDNPVFQSLFLRQIALVAGFMPVIGPFLSKVLNAIADNPREFDMGEFLKAMFQAGVGEFLKMLVEMSVKRYLPPNAPAILKKVSKVAQGIARPVGQALGTVTTNQFDHAGKKVVQAGDKAQEEFEKR